MKRLFKSCLILAVLTCLFPVSEGLAVKRLITTYSQALMPGVQIIRPGSTTLIFTRTFEPATDGILTVTATGDIQDPGESIVVMGEGDTPLGVLFDGTSGSTETDSLTIPLTDLRTFAADGQVEVTFTIPEGNGTLEAFLDSVTLTYEVNVGGVVTKTALRRVVCRNLTTGQSVTINLNGNTRWDCEGAGLIVNLGDKIRMRVEGEADPIK